VVPLKDSPVKSAFIKVDATSATNKVYPEFATADFHSESQSVHCVTHLVRASVKTIIKSCVYSSWSIKDELHKNSRAE